MSYHTYHAKERKRKGSRKCHARPCGHVLRDVAVCGRFFRNTLKVLAINETLDPTLYHVDVWNKARRELSEDLGHQLRMDEPFALSGKSFKISNCP